MEITEVRIGIVHGSKNLRAFASVTFDGLFTVRDFKVIDDGLVDRRPLVTMPSAKKMDPCPQCKCQNFVRANYCNRCGSELAENRYEIGENGKPDVYIDIGFPNTREFRHKIIEAILAEYYRVSSQDGPGYRARAVS